MTCTNNIQGPLLIRFGPTDTGKRPMTSGTAWWVSPDLVVCGQSQDCEKLVSPDPPVNNPVQGTTYKVQVKATNIGSQVVHNVTAQVWVCDFTMGIGTFSALASGGGSSGMAATKGFAAQINPNDFFVFEFGPWTPSATDLATNQGHICLAANVYATGDPEAAEGQPIPPGNFGSGTGASFDPDFPCNSHHAQHNITVIPVPQGGNRKIVVPVKAANPDLERAFETRVELKQAFGRAALGLPEARQLLGHGILKPLPEINNIFTERFNPRVRAPMKFQAAPIDLSQLVLNQPDPQGRPIPIAIARRPPADWQIRNDDGEPRPRRPLQLKIKPQTAVPVNAEIALSPRAPVGSVSTFDLTNTTSDGTVLGGVRVVTVIVP